jgi:hypothetical protein
VPEVQVIWAAVEKQKTKIITMAVNRTAAGFIVVAPVQ